MRLVRGRSEARWFPSRHNFAIFRLYAFFRLRAARPEVNDGLFVIERNQSAHEMWIVAVWVAAVATVYVASALFRVWHPVAALIAALPIALLAVEIPIFVSGLVLVPGIRALTRKHVDSMRASSAVTMAMLAGASAYFALKPGWIRVVACQFFALAALNALAAIVVFSLRDSISRLEAAVGGVQSEQ